MGCDMYTVQVLKGSRAWSMEKKSPSPNKASLLAGDICQEFLCPSDMKSFIFRECSALGLKYAPKTLLIIFGSCWETQGSGIYLRAAGSDGRRPLPPLPLSTSQTPWGEQPCSTRPSPQWCSVSQNTKQWWGPSSHESRPLKLGTNTDLSSFQIVCQVLMATIEH